MHRNTILTSPEKSMEARGHVSPYIIVVKPGIVVMVLIATLSGMYIAEKNPPDPVLVFWTLLGVGLATAGAAALNNHYDRDIDLIMKRTRSRPLPSGSASVGRVLAMGLGFSALSVIVTGAMVNAMTAFLCGASIFIYVVLYTMISKRRTPLATFIGGVGGAAPPVIGYAAIKPELDINAFALFLIIFAWQHPHFWSLALKYIDEYKAAGVRNHPVALGVESTKIRITIWAVIMTLVTILPYYLGMAGAIYLATAIILGAVHIVMAAAFMMSEKKLAMTLFFFSLIQLPALFSMMLIDIV